MFSKNNRTRILLLLCCMVLSFIAIPQVAFADTGIAVIDNLGKLILSGGAFLLFVILLFVGIKKMWEHHLMGLAIIVVFAVLILMVANTDFVVQVAKSIATKIGLSWTGS